MLRPTMKGHKPRGPTAGGRIILTRIREQHRRQIEGKEIGQAEQWQNGINHTFDAMSHWPRVFRRRRKTLIDDNPSSS
jgi:hypothetical protein